MNGVARWRLKKMSKSKTRFVEPIMKVDIHIPDAYTGDVSGDLNHQAGWILGMSAEEGMEVVQAEVLWPKCINMRPSYAQHDAGRGSFDALPVTMSRASSAGEITAKHQAETAHASKTILAQIPRSRGFLNQ